MTTEKSRIGHSWVNIRIKERYSNLVHLDKVKHVAQQSSVHFETRLVKAVSHNSKHILNECKQVLLVETLRNVGCLAHILEQLKENIEALVERQRERSALSF